MPNPCSAPHMRHPAKHRQMTCPSFPQHIPHYWPHADAVAETAQAQLAPLELKQAHIDQEEARHDKPDLQYNDNKQEVPGRKH